MNDHYWAGFPVDDSFCPTSNPSLPEGHKAVVAHTHTHTRRDLPIVYETKTSTIFNPRWVIHIRRIQQGNALISVLIDRRLFWPNCARAGNVYSGCPLFAQCYSIIAFKILRKQSLEKSKKIAKKFVCSKFRQLDFRLYKYSCSRTRRVWKVFLSLSRQHLPPTGKSMIRIEHPLFTSGDNYLLPYYRRHLKPKK